MKPSISNRNRNARLRCKSNLLSVLASCIRIKFIKVPERSPAFMAVVAIPMHYGVERERLWAHRNRIWIGGRRARAHLSKQTAHFNRLASSESRYEHTTRIDLNISETQIDRWASSESDLDHIRDAGVSAPMARFA